MLSRNIIHNIVFTRLIVLGSTPIDLFAFVVDVTKLSVQLPTIVKDILERCPGLFKT